ncbi:hypothetical protein ACLKA7_001376 [Drosophila subpalustris]
MFFINQDLEPGSFKVVVGNCSPSARKQLMAAAANHRPVTRNLTKALEQASAPAQSASLEPNAANMPNNSQEALEISNSTNQSEAVAPHPPANRRRGRPSHSANNRRNNGPDYASIQNMIEQTVTRVLSSLTIRPPSNHDEVLAQPLASRPGSSSLNCFVPPRKIQNQSHPLRQLPSSLLYARLVQMSNAGTAKS